MARVLQIHPSADNHVRVDTKKGFLKGLTNKLCPIPK